MSFRVKIQRMIILFGGILGNLLLHPGVPIKVSPLNRNGDQKMIRCVLKHSKGSILKGYKGYNVHNYYEKNKMSSNHMKAADCCTTIVR